MINNIHRTLYSNEQGNFGIDHTNPTHLLTIGNTETVTVPILITSKADAQIHLVSPDTWTGIKFNDAATGEDFLWHHGENGGVFSMGGGGAFGTNRKLHVHGGVTVGEGFQGETTIGTSNSLFVQNRIGIGTTTPAQALHVHNNSSGSSRIRLQNTEGAWDWAVDQQDMYFATGSDIPFYINSSGNVGVGTTSPNYRFEVKVPNDNGFSIVGASDTNNGWRLKPSGNDFRIGQNGIADRFTIKDGGRVGIATTNPEVTDGGLHIFGTGARAGLRIGGGNDSATESRIYIDSYGDSSYLDSYGNGAHQKFRIETSELHLNLGGGRVGIGTSSPSSTLDIHDASSNATTLTLGRSGEVPTIKAGGTNTDLRLEAVGSDGWIEFRTNNKMQMRITPTGKVGIGTDTPTDELQVKGSNAPYINVEASDVSDSGISFARQGVKKWYILNDPDIADNFAIRGDGGTPDEFLTITQTGKVGIGATSPAYTLDVAGGARFDGEAIVNTAPSDGVYIGKSQNDESRHVSIVAPAGSASYIDFTTTARDYSGRIIYDHTNEWFKFYANGPYEKMRISGSSVSVHNSKLNVNTVTTLDALANIYTGANANVAALLFAENTSSTGIGIRTHFDLGYENNAISFYSKGYSDDQGASLDGEHIRIRADGRIGFSTADVGTWDETVTVNTKTSYTMSFVRQAGTPHLLFKNTNKTGTGRIYMDADIFQISQGNTDGTLLASWIYGDANRNIGINTDSPSYKLHVNGADAMSGNWSKSLKLSATHPVICFAGGGSKHAFIGYDTASSTEGLSLNVSGTTDDRNSSTLGIKINNRGYVGVGFNNPSYRLDVNDDSGTYKIPGLRLLGPSPTMKFEDTESDDFYLHVNSDNFYIMTDKNDDNTHDSPYPLRLDNSTSKGYVYSHEIVHAGNAYDYLPRMISTNYFNHIPLPYNCTANATTPRRTRIMRTTIDTNDWSSKGTIMIQLFERYYYGDRMKRYIIDFNPYTTPGGSETPNARAILVEEIGTGLGSYYDVYCETATHGTDSNGGNIRYCDIWVRCKSYAQVSVVITTNSNLDESTTPKVNWSYIWEESPTLEDISNFTAESETVDQRAVHVNKTMSGSLIAKSEAHNRPLFPGGFVSTEAGGSADIWSPDRTNHPTSSTTSQRWGIKWDDPNNQIIFMGGGSNRLLIDLDGGSGGLTWEGHKIWNAGNDGSGSGLDADTLDGVHASNFIRKSGLGTSSYYSADAWIEMKDVNHGIYWSGGSGSGWHLYPKNTTDFFVRSGSTNTALQFCGQNTTPWGYVYANNSSELGFLNAGRSWRILCKMGTDGTSYYNPNIWFKGEQNSAWSGDAGNDEGKIEYHADRFYFNSGANANTDATFQFRRGGTNISHINSSGKYMGDTDKVDGLHASSFVRSDAADTIAASHTFSSNNHITFGANSTWGAYLRVGGNGRTVTNSDLYASIATTNGNIHIDSGTSRSTYLNYYSGTGGTVFGNGAGTVSASMDSGGQLWKGSVIGTGYKYWHAGNDGSGSGLDADTVDGLQASNFLRSGSSTQTIYGGQFHATDWFRNSIGTGLYNSGTDSHFYSAGANYWHINGDSGQQTSGGLVFYSQYNSAQGNATGRKGYVYWDSSGFGLLSNDGSWGVRCTNTTTDLYGTIRQDGSNTVWHAGNDGSGSGLDADLVDGVHGGSFLRSDASDTFTGLLSVGSTTSRRAGMYGIYDSTKTGHIWSMGTSYVIDNSGANFGTLYGFAYKHTNNSTGGTMGGGHMAVWCQNGTPYVSLGTNIWCRNNITAYSDARVKDDITTITNAVDKVKSIRGVTYHRTDFDDSVEDSVEKNKRQMGVIAQEILDVIPEVVTGGPTDQDPEGHYSVAYGNMVALLIEAVKEQQTQLDKQQQQIEQLKQQIEK